MGGNLQLAIRERGELAGHRVVAAAGADARKKMVDRGGIALSAGSSRTLPLVAEFTRLLSIKPGEQARTRDTIEFAGAREIVLEWRDFGSTFGFVPLSHAATAPPQAMDASRSLEESARKLRTFLSVARRLWARAG